MSTSAIITLIIASLIVTSVIGVWVYKKVKHKPTGECSCCALANKDLLLKEFKKISKKD